MERTRFLLRALGVGVAALLIVLGYLFVRYEILERRFRQIHPDDSEAQLLEVVGAPTSVRACGEGGYKAPRDEMLAPRRCVREYWYSTYIFSDGWLVWIDDGGQIIQIRRLALP
jgi:hypothetical protein